MLNRSKTNFGAVTDRAHAQLYARHIARLALGAFSAQGERLYRPVQTSVEKMWLQKEWVSIRVQRCMPRRF